MTLSSRMARIAPSPTLRVTALDVIHEEPVERVDFDVGVILEHFARNLDALVHYFPNVTGRGQSL